LRVIIPRFYAALKVAPVEVLANEIEPGADEPRVLEIITDQTFLNGRLTHALELSSMLRNRDPLDPEFRPQFEEWVKKAAHMTREDLRGALHEAGLKEPRGEKPKILGFRSLDTHYVDRATGEVVYGVVTTITLILKTPFDERLYANRMEAFVDEKLVTEPAADKNLIVKA